MGLVRTNKVKFHREKVPMDSSTIRDSQWSHSQTSIQTNDSKKDRPHSQPHILYHWPRTRDIFSRLTKTWCRNNSFSSPLKIISRCVALFLPNKYQCTKSAHSKSSQFSFSPTKCTWNHNHSFISSSHSPSTCSRCQHNSAIFHNKSNRHKGTNSFPTNYHKVPKVFHKTA